MLRWGMPRDFAREIAALEADLATDRWRAVLRLRQVHEAWARHLLGLADHEPLVPGVRAAVARGVSDDVRLRAREQLGAAERYQWEIGSWSTGPGEGLASMFEVRTLQVARAWLTPDPDEARALLQEVLDDPNGMGERLRPHIEAWLSR